MTKQIESIYIIGSLRNQMIPVIANQLRSAGLDVFDDWYAAGPEADDYWKAYEQGRGHTYTQALKGRAARNVLQFDRNNLVRCDAAVLVLPAGRSGHLELGFVAGYGKPCFILLPDEHDRWDVMYGFATDVFNKTEDLIKCLRPNLTTSAAGPMASGASVTSFPSTGTVGMTTK